MNHPDMQTIAAALNVDCEQSVHDSAMGRLREDVMSSEPKFTPGPWYASFPTMSNGYWYINTKPHMQGNVAVIYNDPTGADARLIAAAPALYAALKDMRSQLAFFKNPRIDISNGRREQINHCLEIIDYALRLAAATPGEKEGTNDGRFS